MTVQELITELTQFEPDLEVRARIANSAQSHTLRGAPVRISSRAGMFAEIPVDPDDYIELFPQRSFDVKLPLDREAPSASSDLSP